MKFLERKIVVRKSPLQKPQVLRRTFSRERAILFCGSQSSDPQ
jgi:hypothetical protein